MRTQQNVKGEDGKPDEEADSDLRKDGTSDSFDLTSFDGDRFGRIDLGYKMPDDVEVKVWDDLNGNGIQVSSDKANLCVLPLPELTNS